MAFKCYCAECAMPLYFENDVPIPQICADCLREPSIQELKQWVFATARSLDRSGLTIEQYNSISRRVVRRFNATLASAVRGDT